MAGDVFTITELLRDGAVVTGGAARFEWTVDALRPGAAARGGVRAMPRRPWSMGTSVRHKRTDYPGGDEPTHQVFGPSAKDITFDGEWDDRWNFAGYARAARRAFNDMVRRGNLVRIETSGLSWVGLITESEYPYEYDARIGYRFTLSPQTEEDAAPLRPVSNGNKPLSASALTSSLSTDVGAIQDLRALAAPPLAGTFLDTLNDALDTVEAAFAEADAAVQERIVAPGEEARLAVLRVGQLFGQIASSANTALVTLGGWRADLQLAWRTAESVIRFDAWTKALSAQLRLLSVHAYDASQEVERRADPDARALYRPHQGEHLMAISTSFYGSPHQWRSLMTRNGLTYPVMTGDELLVIPAAGTTGA